MELDAPRNKELWSCLTSLISASMVCSTAPRKLYCVQRCSMTSRTVRTCMIPVICPDQMVINDVALFEPHRMCPSACKSWQRIPGPNFQFRKLGQHKLSYFQREAVFPNRGRFFSTAMFASLLQLRKFFQTLVFPTPQRFFSPQEGFFNTINFLHPKKSFTT